MSIGGSSSKQSSSSSSVSDSIGMNVASSHLSADQLAMQTGLYGKFNNVLDANSGAIPQYSGAGYLNTASNISTGNTAPGAALNSAAAVGQNGLNALGQFINPMNPALQGQINNLGSDLGRVYREQILPGIGANFGIAGQRGSSRQGIAQGMAANDVMNQFTTGATNLLAHGYDTAVGAAGTLGQLGTNAAAQAGNLQLGGTTAGLAGVNDLNTGAINARNAAFSPFAVGSGIVGSPSTLSNAFGFDMSNSSSTSKSKGTANEAHAGIMGK